MKMSNMTSESEDRADSPTTIDEEASTERNIMMGGTLKKGPWTSAEDAILVDYVNKHGEGNWNAVQKHSGLSRCGKSCRLRWANHLRPDLKKGAFTPEEERRIIELHAKMGNKWARMAVEVRAFLCFPLLISRISFSCSSFSTHHTKFEPQIQN